MFYVIEYQRSSYTGSRLTKVSDAAADVVYTGAADFVDGADSATEYTYDSDGRLLSDANKDITSIKYNVLGLPAVVTFADGSSITNRYSAAGTLLQRVKTEPVKIILPLALTPTLNPNSKVTVDNHIGALTFRKNALHRINTPTGYFAYGAMHYYIKDYQGNIRQVTDADGAVEQDNHYYPYGMLMGESSDILTAGSNANRNPYLYGAKEYLTTAGANLLDFTARTYDPSLPLFHTQDRKATKYTSFNSYIYCGADPINWIDPDGKEKQCLSHDNSVILAADNFPDNNNIIVITHGHQEYMEYDLLKEGGRITSVDEFCTALLCEFESVNGSTLYEKPMIIELHSCETGRINEKCSNPIAQQISEGLPNTIVAAPNGYLFINRDTKNESVYDTIELKQNSTSNSKDNSTSNSKYIGKDRANPEWRYFHKGVEIHPLMVNVIMFQLECDYYFNNSRNKQSFHLPATEGNEDVNRLEYWLNR